MKQEKRHKYYDFSLFFVIIFLLCFGLIMLYSASSATASLDYGDSTYYLKSQIKSTIIGLVAMIVVSFVDYKIYKRLAEVAYIASAVVVLLIYSPLGKGSHGATRWLSLGGFTIQPVELVKIGVIVVVAALVSKTYKQANKLRYIVVIMGVVLPLVALVAVVTSNMSSALIVLIIAGIMVFVASPKYLQFVAIIASGFAALLLVILVTGNYWLKRIQTWISSLSDISSGQYQIIQGIYAIASGGLFGKGLGQSIQKSFVPESHNDMIFSIICEELGIVGAFAVIFIYAFLLWRMMVIADNAEDMFGSFLVIGVMAQVGVQVMLNIAVVTNTIPATGISLPFISYGGSSVVTLLIEMGIVLSVSRSINAEVEKDEEKK